MAIEEAVQTEDSDVGAITTGPGRRVDSAPPQRRDWNQWNSDFDKAVLEAMSHAEEANEPDDAPAGDQAAGDESSDEGGVESAETARAESNETTGEGKSPAWSLDDPEDYKAYQALRRYKWPHKQIEQLSRDEMLALGAECARMQADQDRYSSSKGSATETEQATEAEPVASNGNGQPAGREQMLAAVRPAVQPLAAALGLETEEEAGVLAGSFLDAVVSLLGPVAQRVQLLQDNLEADRSELVRSELVAKVPPLKDDSIFQRVSARVNELRSTSIANTLKGKARELALYEAAAKLEIPDLPSQSELLRQRKVAKWRDNGVANQETIRGTPKPLTEDELYLRVLEAHEQQVPREQILARYGRRRS